MSNNDNYSFSPSEATLELMFPGAFIESEDGTLLHNGDTSPIGETAVGHRLWVQTPRLPNKTDSGFYLGTEQALDETESLTQWGVVRQMGRDCYKDDPSNVGLFGGPYCSEGQIVRIPRFSEIMRKKIDGIGYILIDDIRVVTVIYDWKSLIKR